MKICFVVPNLDIASGWGRYAHDVVEGARRAGHGVVIVQVERSGVSLLASLVDVIRLSRGSGIIYAIDGWPFGVLAWLASRVRGTRLIIGAVGTYTISPFLRARTAWLMRRAYAAADAVISISRYTKDRLLVYVPHAKITVITPGISYDRWQIGETERTQDIISVGALKPRKGYHILLEAFALARKKIPDLQWTIVGDHVYHSYFKRLTERAIALGVVESIQWHERVSDGQLRDLYAKSRLFVLLSENKDDRFEGFGIVFLEAAATGLPVIGTTGNGISDAVGPNNGVLVPQKDAQSAADAIVALIEDRVAWQVQSHASREWARAHDVAAMFAAHERIYELLQP